MLSLIYFILSTAGMTWILVNGHIFSKIRPKHEFFHCSACVGFHVGWLVCLLSQFTALITIELCVVNLLLCACISTITSYYIDKLVGDDGINVNYENSRIEESD